MKRIMNYKVAALAILLAFSATACKKKFLDVNENPNNPEKVDVSYVLPAAQQAVGYTMGNQFAILGGLWSQYWTQGPNANQYNDIDRYSYVSSEADRPWSQMYAQALTDFDYVYNKGIEEDKPNYSAIARIMEVYTFQVMTDAFGDVPFTEALKGYSDNITSPKYDAQSSIYPALEAMLDEGIGLMDATKATPGAEDLVYQGNMDLWLKFANTLKLKIYLRQIYQNPGISTKVSALMASGGPFLDEGEDGVLSYANGLGTQNPLHATFSALTNYNLLASNTAISYLTAINDPRIADFYDPAENTGNFNGIDQGSGKLLLGAQDNKNFSFPGAQVTGSTATVTLMSGAESYFLQAEANARGFGSGDGLIEYEAGITASWDRWENSAAAAAADLPAYLASDSVAYPVSASGKIRNIITQKWIAMCGNQNMESWIEWRRTGYPEFFKESATSILGPGQFPQRVLYPSDEITSNSNYPGTKVITEKVWWDAN